MVAKKLCDMVVMGDCAIGKMSNYRSSDVGPEERPPTRNEW
jgi:hypothetical protein